MFWVPSFPFFFLFFCLGFSVGLFFDGYTIVAFVFLSFFSLFILFFLFSFVSFFVFGFLNFVRLSLFLLKQRPHVFSSLVTISSSVF